MDRMLTLAAMGESVTGLLLLLDPGLVSTLLLGSGVSGAGMAVARVAGLALIGLAAACLPDPAARRMLVYNLPITAYLAWLGMTQTATGPLLWPAVLLHGMLTTLISIHLRQRQRSDARS